MLSASTSGTIDEVVPYEDRAVARISAASAESLIFFAAEQMPDRRPSTLRLGWDLRNQGYEELWPVMVAAFGETPAECWCPAPDGGLILWPKPWLNAKWESFDRDYQPGHDVLLVDLADEAMAWGWKASPQVAAGVEALRKIADQRRAERDRLLVDALFQEESEMSNTPGPVSRPSVTAIGIFAS